MARPVGIKESRLRSRKTKKQIEQERAQRRRVAQRHKNIEEFIEGIGIEEASPIAIGKSLKEINHDKFSATYHRLMDQLGILALQDNMHAARLWLDHYNDYPYVSIDTELEKFSDVNDLIIEVINKRANCEMSFTEAQKTLELIEKAAALRERVLNPLVKKFVEKELKIVN